MANSRCANEFPELEVFVVENLPLVWCCVVPDPEITRAGTRKEPKPLLTPPSRLHKEPSPTAPSGQRLVVKALPSMSGQDFASGLPAPTAIPLVKIMEPCLGLKAANRFCQVSTLPDVVTNSWENLGSAKTPSIFPSSDSWPVACRHFAKDV